MLARFVDDDFGYLRWLNETPECFVLNSERRPSRSFVVVHRGSCASLRSTREGLTSRFLKVCASTLAEIDQWSRENVGVQPSRCHLCKP